MQNPPVVLSFSGHDPTGGAGIQADHEAIIAMGCHAVSIITCLTVQDTHNVASIKPLDAEYILQQARKLLADIKISAFKIGLVGSCDIVIALASLLKQYPQIPVVFDPVLAAGGGTSLAKSELLHCIQTQLLPVVTLVTPNVPEAQALSIFDGACENILLTGTHNESTKDVINILYRGGKVLSALSWSRLPDVYHGSGCTLASAIAAGVANGLSLIDSVEVAQQYTWDSLSQARKVGGGQLIPLRSF
ncbi:MAG TPA: hydroxymethylpyrimidine/phosphomethylpyrimidine kinase [Leucothrix mucor]|uniref:hydroxymethylpyrimidine kinase n=1 Tax=Leucothrix mucor TaxID=45248 RepID=A0A7V2T160_LEUMU|nr:hydroxymethylpyrimidine/phosphomethylpyrimidine kinase [Leucothrix mucor]